MQLAGRITLVTGGGSGLGLAAATALTDRGARVVIADLPTERAQEAAAAIGARFVAADILDEEQLAVALDAIEEAGPLRAVVHTAGRGGDRLRILDRDGGPAPMASFEEVVRLNLFGTYNVLRLCAARMAGNEELVDGERGAFVLTASVAAFDGQIGQTSYAASKAAVHGITLVAARDLASWAIRVNTIAPGLFDTPMLARLRQDIREGLAESVPFPRRLGAPAEFGSLAVNMIENGYLNGETVRLDGSIRMAPR
ncbi:SDR family NAD(P)-dependent oxidoreductase [Streptomyces bobili]|uniref:SDR family NAD(P)-dependent oxidoreductase n=1 Tax=Streptomyces bobili TaxID=67280 RepID=UPI00364C700C